MARLKKGEKIDALLYDGYSTISLGYAGLYEMCVRMTGKSHTDPEGKPFALAVMQRLNMINAGNGKSEAYSAIPYTARPWSLRRTVSQNACHAGLA